LFPFLQHCPIAEGFDRVIWALERATPSAGSQLVSSLPLPIPEHSSAVNIEPSGTDAEVRHAANPPAWPASA